MEGDACEMEMDKLVGEPSHAESHTKSRRRRSTGKEEDAGARRSNPASLKEENETLRVVEGPSIADPASLSWRARWVDDFNIDMDLEKDASSRFDGRKDVVEPVGRLSLAYPMHTEKKIESEFPIRRGASEVVLCHPHVGMNRHLVQKKHDRLTSKDRFFVDGKTVRFVTVRSEENMFSTADDEMSDWQHCKQPALVDGEIVRMSLNRLPAPTIAVTNEQGFSFTGRADTPLSMVTLCERAKLIARKNVNYFSLHFCYFVVMCLIGAALIFAIDDLPFIDSAFIAVSAMCVTGLSTVDFSKVSVQSKVVVLFLILVGSQVFFDDRARPCPKTSLQDFRSTSSSCTS
jgi:hypothetical protein